MNALTASCEVHGVGDGVVSVDAERDKHVSRTVRHDALDEPKYL